MHAFGRISYTRGNQLHCRALSRLGTKISTKAAYKHTIVVCLVLSLRIDIETLEGELGNRQRFREGPHRFLRRVQPARANLHCEDATTTNAPFDIA